MQLNYNSCIVALIIEGVCGIRPEVTFDAMSISPHHSQVKTRKFVRRIW